MARKKKTRQGRSKKQATKGASRGTGGAVAPVEVVSPAPAGPVQPIVPATDATGSTAARASSEAAPSEREAPIETSSRSDEPEARSGKAVLIPPPDPSENLDADLDLDDGSDYESLIALVAAMPDGEDTGAHLPVASGPETEDEVHIVDLDDDEVAEPVDRLIAHAVVGAEPTQVDEEPEIPVIDLDADEGSLTTRARPSRPAPAADDALERLAQLAARGGVEEPDIPTFYLDEDEVSTPEARARLLAETLAHAAHQEARYRVPIDIGATRRLKSAAAAFLFLTAFWIGVAPPGWIRPEAPAQLNVAARDLGLRTALLLQAEQVEAFRIVSERLPDSLDELPVRLPGVRYTRSGSRAYQLIAYTPEGEPIVYDSSAPAPPFQALLDGWPPVERAP